MAWHYTISPLVKCKLHVVRDFDSFIYVSPRTSCNSNSKPVLYDKWEEHQSSWQTFHMLFIWKLTWKECSHDRDHHTKMNYQLNISSLFSIFPTPDSHLPYDTITVSYVWSCLHIDLISISSFGGKNPCLTLYFPPYHIQHGASAQPLDCGCQGW